MTDPNLFDDVPISQSRESSFVTPTDEMEGAPEESAQPHHLGSSPETFDEDIPSERAQSPKQRKGVPLPKRINQLTYEKKLLEEQLQQAEYMRQIQLGELQRENQAYRAQLAQKEVSEIDNLESTIQSNEQVILNEMRRAKEDQDISAEMKWQRELNELQKASAQIQAHKAARQFHVEESQDEYFTEPLIQRPMPQQSMPDLNPHFLEWTESTPWANQNDPNYSPDLMSEADEIAVELNKKLQVARRGDVIGTPDYFSAINEIIEARHGLGGEDMGQDQQPEPQQRYQSTPANHVGGVNRQGATMAEQYSRQNQGNRSQYPSARLSPEQEMIARNLQIRGNDTRLLNPMEARARYVRHLNAPVAPGGTPYRMIIDHGI